MIFVERRHDTFGGSYPIDVGNREALDLDGRSKQTPTNSIIVSWLAEEGYWPYEGSRGSPRYSPSGEKEEVTEDKERDKASGSPPVACACMENLRRKARTDRLARAARRRTSLLERSDRW